MDLDGSVVERSYVKRETLSSTPGLGQYNTEGEGVADTSYLELYNTHM